MNHAKFDVKTGEVRMKYVSDYTWQVWVKNTNILLVSQLYGQKGAN